GVLEVQAQVVEQPLLQRSDALTRYTQRSGGGQLRLAFEEAVPKNAVEHWVECSNVGSRRFQHLARVSP
ncbi:MAG: hypothetical protein K0R38_4092, partial [Polyangiaceae bacterium]|nr:hypothetical protein [Polyangiaceae bacterium]